MCGMDEMQEPLFTTVKLEDFVPADHPLRPVQLLVNRALKLLNGLFGVIYADRGPVRRSRRRNCCGPCCCRCFTRCAASAC